MDERTFWDKFAKGAAVIMFIGLMLSCITNESERQINGADIDRLREMNSAILHDYKVLKFRIYRIEHPKQKKECKKWCR